MEMALFCYIVFLLFGFTAMYFAFSLQVKSFEKNRKFTFFMQPIIYVFILYALGTFGAYYLTDNSDFIAKPVCLFNLCLRNYFREKNQDIYPVFKRCCLCLLATDRSKIRAVRPKRICV